MIVTLKQPARCELCRKVIPAGRKADRIVVSESPVQLAVSHHPCCIPVPEDRSRAISSQDASQHCVPGCYGMGKRR